MLQLEEVRCIITSSGYDNVAIGKRALFSNTTGFYNVANGTEALYNNETGRDNVAIGFQSLYNNVGGSNNFASGFRALYSNQASSGNIAIGFEALYGNVAGIYNIAHGYTALRNNTGEQNIASGVQSLYYNTSGSNNIALGTSALFYNQIGSNNIAIGTNTNLASVAYSNAIAIGKEANCLSSNSVRIGNASMLSIGGFQNWTAISDARFKKNVKEDVSGLDFILGLRPVTYTLDKQSIDEFTGVTKLAKSASSELDLELSEQSEPSNKMIHSGFIAQEVEQLAKSIGYEFSGVDAPKNEQDHYGLRYAEFVVPLVKATQELNQKLESENGLLRSEIDQLKMEMEAIKELINRQ